MTPTIIKPNWVGRVIPEPFAWCIVPTGKVTLEKGGYLTQAITFEVPEFQIARYPITNAQFEVFVTARDGWRDPKWWDYSTDAKAWRTENPTSEDAKFNDCADCPRESITWYAALAFTRWLSAKTEEKISLPTEQHWQRAAQGDSNRAYPWGNDWGANLCNSLESGIVKTTPVTQYPQGASPFGALEMSGNVWEWCSTAWETGTSDLIGARSRCLRGGSWNYSGDYAQVAFRGSGFPFNRDDFRGFRVCLSYPT